MLISYVLGSHQPSFEGVPGTKERHIFGTNTNSKKVGGVQSSQVLIH